jgi:hypothetical protein
MSIKVQTYLDDGRVFEYSVTDEGKAREHASAIVMGGYRHNTGKDYLEHYPPHRILKVKLVGNISTKYPDKVRGT